MKLFIQNTLLVVIGVLFALLLAESLLSFQFFQYQPLAASGGVDVKELARRSAQSRGAIFDERPLKEVIEQSRSKNPRSFPALSPAYFLTSDGGSLVTIEGTPVVPLGIASSAENYYCNESGVFEKFETDPYGFRNPADVWNGNVDILAIGDSFTLGSCLSEADSIVGNLRREYNVINLGQGANGPLIELASLREFAPIVKPKLILWNFFPNDMTDDLVRDRKSVILNKYLDPDFSQNIFDRNADVQKAVDLIAEDYWQRIRQAPSKNASVSDQSLWSLPKLSALYRAFRVWLSDGSRVDKIPDIEFFIKILWLANQQAKSLDANFLFVYLPDCNDYSYGQNFWKAELVNSVRSMGIDVFDAEELVTEQEKNGSGAFYYCPGSHYSKNGARAVANGIQRRISSTFESRIKSK